MHFSPAAIALSTTLMLVSSVGFAQADHEPTPQSAALVASGQTAEQSGDLEGAFALYVSALAYDPLNFNAYVAMGDVAYAQNLYGSAIRYYGRALEFDPTDPDALAGQGGAYVAKGAIQRAQGNLQKLELACARGCEAIDRLEERIAAGPPKRLVTAEQLQSNPTAHTAPELPEADDDAGVLIDE